MAWEQIKDLTERNKNQKKVYINLDNVDILFNKNKNEILCHDKIFNLCQKYVTQYMKFTSNFELKKELATSALCKLYIHFKRTLLKMQAANPDKKPELVFYLSQFYYYVHLTARNEIYMHNNRLKKSPQFIEFRQDVDYTQPIEKYINSLEDIDGYIQVNEKIVLTSNDYNRDNRKIEDNSSYESKFDFDRILVKIKNYFTDDEINVIKDIYNGNENKINSSILISIQNKIANNDELKTILMDFIQ